MRKSRLKAPPHHPIAYYHCVSRVVDRQFVLGPEEKEEFVRLMRLYEDFCEVRVITYCVMSNHFHVLVEVSQRPVQMPDDTQLLAKLKRLYSPEAFAQVRWQLENLLRLGAHAEAATLRESFFARMWDVSFFMKGLKQRFSGWHNRRQGRKGTLWEERFKSVLVESGQALVTMATYIDLNPVRAGLVQDPKEYRWCGYAAAAAGKRRARSGLKTAMTTWAHGDIGEDASMEKYRELLFGVGEQKKAGSNGQRVKRGISRERVEEVLAKKGKLTRWEMLRCRVRYFCDGAVLGSKEFVNGIFTHERHRFGPKRKSGARPMRHVEADGLTTLRDLRLKPLG
jgi:REP element-mobilizing transposase RayT